MQTTALTQRARKRIARLAAGLTMVAVLGAACGQGKGGTDVQASPQAAPAAAAVDHGSLHGELLGQTAGSTADGAAKLRQTLTAALQEHEYLAGIAVAQAVVTKKTDSPEFTASARPTEFLSRASATASFGRLGFTELSRAPKSARYPSRSDFALVALAVSLVSLPTV